MDMDGTAILPRYHRIRHHQQPCGSSATTGGAIVVDVVIPPQTAEEPHTHLRPSFMILDCPAPISVNIVDDHANTIEVFRREPDDADDKHDCPAEVPEFQTMDPEGLHFVRNLSGRHPLRATRIEFDGIVLGRPSDDAGIVSLAEKVSMLCRHPKTRGLYAASDAARAVGAWQFADRVAIGWRVDIGKHVTPTNDGDQVQPDYSERVSAMLVPSGEDAVGGKLVSCIVVEGSSAVRSADAFDIVTKAVDADHSDVTAADAAAPLSIQVSPDFEAEEHRHAVGLPRPHAWSIATDNNAWIRLKGGDRVVTASLFVFVVEVVQASTQIG